MSITEGRPGNCKADPGVAHRLSSRYVPRRGAGLLLSMFGPGEKYCAAKSLPSSTVLFWGGTPMASQSQWPGSKQNADFPAERSTCRRSGM